MIEFKDSERFRGIKNLATETSGVSCISGISESRSALVAGIISSQMKGQLLIVTPSFLRAKKLAEDLLLFVDRKIHLIPEETPSPLAFDAKSQDILVERLSALTSLAMGEECIIVSSVEGAIKKLAPKPYFIDNFVHIKIGQQIDIENIKRRLTYMGYERVGSVEAKGQYVIRGGILDIFPPDQAYPCRIELFDIEVDSLRFFDPETQRSVHQVDSITISPARIIVQNEHLFPKAITRINEAYESFASKLPLEKREKLLLRKAHIIESLETETNLQLLENHMHFIYEEVNYLWDYLKKGSGVIIDDPQRVTEALELAEKDHIENFKEMLNEGEAVPEDFSAFSGTDDFQRIYKDRPAFVFTPFQKQLKGIDTLKSLITISSKQGTVFNGRMDFLEGELLRYVKFKYRTIIICSTADRAENMMNFVERCGISQWVEVYTGDLSVGMEFPEEKLAIVSDKDIFVTVKHKRPRKESEGHRGIKAFSDIREGDFVVHESHGIGKFLGVNQLEVQGIKKDYLKIKYAGEDVLYIPVEQMDVIQRYIGSEGGAPKVSKLGGGEWKKIKLRARESIENMAKELLALSAARQLEKGYGFAKDNLWQKEFEDLFPYEETPDQLRSIREIKRNMEENIPMDRLLCGDVGYGKTEVAARAVFKCIADGKQAAFLVPTTLLANQHYYTFKERFESFPFKIDVLSRFRTEAQQEEILQKVKKGQVDVLIGTHRLLSKDVAFKDLGLLVIDEEQRFGVMHKEAIKKLRQNVDVLTLSATPIPRTLHMSLVGVRDMSLIEEPPEERYPVQTYVMEQEDSILKEAVERELERGGQVYIVFNRVRGIQKIASNIRQLLPKATVAVAHGQMDEKSLEDIMLQFVNNECNVLISTTIIESGIDIPNANTMIILDADKLGLSQLYQLRGRVGRSNRMAYAYLMYQRDKVLSEQAEKRLRAIREFTEFGAGFHIAMRDLEIRGAGNLLGTEQHGHMMMIGYELYCKLVEEAVKELSGDLTLDRDNIEVSIELPVEAHIPNEYISDELTKLQMYKKIASIRSDKDQEEIIDELLDRFGDIPKETLNLIGIAFIKAMAGKSGISRVRQEQGRLIFDFEKANSLEPQKIAYMSTEYGMNLFVHGGQKPYMKLTPKTNDRISESIGFLTRLAK